MSSNSVLSEVVKIQVQVSCRHREAETGELLLVLSEEKVLTEAEANEMQQAISVIRVVYLVQIRPFRVRFPS